MSASENFGTLLAVGVACAMLATSVGGCQPTDYPATSISPSRSPASETPLKTPPAFGQQIMSGFLAGLILIPVGAVLTLLASKGYGWYRTTRPANRVWRFGANHKVLIVTPDPSGYVDQEFSDTVFPTDYLAVAELRNFLSRVYSKLEITEYFAKEVPPQRYGEHVAIIGGTEINPLTSVFLKQAGSNDLPLEFESDKIIDRLDGDKEYRPELIRHPGTKRNEIVKDYAMVLGIANPFRSSSRAFILAGCYVHGDLAAALSLVEPLVRDVSKKSKGATQFAFITESPVLHRFVGEVNIVRFYFFDEKERKWVGSQ